MLHTNTSNQIQMNNQNRRVYSSTTGRVAEARFQRAAEKLGLKVIKSQKDQDIHLHVDYWLSHDGGSNHGVDVKGNNLPDEIWCEFRNVNGDPGWMYGYASIVAFDMPEEGGFCVVDTKDLRKYCEDHVEDVVVTHKSNAYKKKYQRKNRQDIITRIYLSDLKAISSYRVWEYNKDY